MNFLPERLMELRKQNNYSIRELAELCNTSKSSIAAYEKGERNPKQEVLENMARALKCDVFYLTGKTDVPITLTNKSFFEANLSEKELQLFTLIQMLGEGSDDVYEEIKIVIDEIKKEKSAPIDSTD